MEITLLLVPVPPSIVVTFTFHNPVVFPVRDGNGPGNR